MSRIQFVNLPTDKEQCNGCFSRTQMGKLEDPSSRPAPSAAKNPAVNIQAALAGCNQPQAQAAQPRPSHIVKWRILCSCLQPPGGQLKFPPQTHAGCFSRLQSSSKKQPRPVTQAAPASKLSWWTLTLDLPTGLRYFTQWGPHNLSSRIFSQKTLFCLENFKFLCLKISKAVNAWTFSQKYFDNLIFRKSVQQRDSSKT